MINQIIKERVENNQCPHCGVSCEGVYCSSEHWNTLEPIDHPDIKKPNDYNDICQQAGRIFRVDPHLNWQSVAELLDVGVKGHSLKDQCAKRGFYLSDFREQNRDRIARDVIRFFTENPTKEWKDCFKAVRSPYKNSNSLLCAMNHRGLRKGDIVIDK